jgi:hypothetical protein
VDAVGLPQSGRFQRPAHLPEDPGPGKEVLDESLPARARRAVSTKDSIEELVPGLLLSCQ